MGKEKTVEFPVSRGAVGFVFRNALHLRWVRTKRWIFSEQQGQCGSVQVLLCVCDEQGWFLELGKAQRRWLWWQVLLECLCAERQSRFGSGERFSLLSLCAGADGVPLCRKAK
jgi:hypothetical protein